MTQHITVRDKNSDAYAIVHVQTNPQFATMVSLFRSKRIKHPKRVLTRTPEKTIADEFELVALNKKAKEHRRASNKAARELEVGDILACSFGYSMTLVQFYRVVKLVGNQSVRLEELSSNLESNDNGWSGYKVPDLNGSTEPLDSTYRVQRGTTVKISDSQYAHKWDGKPMYYNSLD